MSGLQKAAVYGGIGCCAVLGWTTRSVLKQIFTNQLQVTGAGPSKDWQGTCQNNSSGPLHGDILANMLGAFIFGLVSKSEKDLKPSHPSFYVGITTGFAGSCTTFSSWMMEAGKAIWLPLNCDGTNDWTKQVLRGVLVIVAGFYCLLGSLAVGKWIGAAVMEHIHFVQSQAPAAEPQATAIGNAADAIAAVPAPATKPAVVADGQWLHRKVAIYWFLLLTLWITLWIIVIIKAVKGKTGDVTTVSSDGKYEAVLVLGMCFAPIGAWTRFELAKYNVSWPRFPLYTFIANTVGVIVSVALYVAKAETVVDPSKPMMARKDVWIGAIGGGFCGCLSTASTFANEVEKLGRNPSSKPSTNALIYAVVSIFVAQLIILNVINIYQA